MRLFNWLGLYAKIEQTRERRVLQLEDQIIALERARGEQVDINAQIRRAHEDKLRADKHAHDDALREHRLEVEKLERRLASQDEEVGHLMRIRDEKREAEFARREIDKDAARNAAIQAVKDEYQAKLEAHLNGQIKSLGEQYENLLKRLPDVNVALKGRVGA